MPVPGEVVAVAVGLPVGAALGSTAGRAAAALPPEALVASAVASSLAPITASARRLEDPSMTCTAYAVAPAKVRLTAVSATRTIGRSMRPAAGRCLPIWPIRRFLLTTVRRPAVIDCAADGSRRYPFRGTDATNGESNR